MIKKVFDNLKSYFEISNFERRGVYSLLFILLLFASFYWLKNNYSFTNDEVDEEAKQAFALQIKKGFGERKFSPKSKIEKKIESKYNEKLTYFNPNADSYEVLVSKGIEPKVAKNIVNYRSKGGEYRSPKDVARLYAISELYFNRIKPYIEIENEAAPINNSVKQLANSEIIKQEMLNIELNTATVEELIKLKGVGNYYANKIKRDIEWKGGYYSKNQLYAIKDLPQETVDNILNFVNVNPDKIKRIHLNSADFETLRRHPFLKYKEAQSIINYREQHGQFISLEQLKKIHLLKDKDFSQILPYLDLN